MKRLQALTQRSDLHKIIKLRHRAIFTRSNKIRLRYVAAFYACVPMATIFAWHNLSQSQGGGAWTALPEIEMAASTLPGSALPYDSAAANLAQLRAEATAASPEAALHGAAHQVASAPLPPAPKNPGFIEVEVGQGDTIGKVLESAGIDKDDSYQIVEAMRKYYDPKNLRPGQKIRVDYTPSGTAENSSPEPTKISVQVSSLKELSVSKDGAENFIPRLHEKSLNEQTFAGKAVIENSLYGSAAKAGIPSSVIAEVIRVYSLNTDFQRDIKPGDKLEVLYKGFETENGDFARAGDVIYANLVVNGKSMPVYRYDAPGGSSDYFQPDGRSIRKTLMKTPIDGARISSTYGMRFHPVLGYSKMHKGIDFAAPIGTPIYAAGSGVLEYAGRFSSYGNYIRIRHNNDMKTAYAHMSRLARGMRVGSKVAQGDIIGYVGTTGRSTGPHLHYEILVHNRQTNPNSMNLPTGQLLAGKDLKAFKARIAAIQQQYASLSEDTKLANVHDFAKSRNLILR